ncbi:hypothetical protein ACKKBG_A15060 [Auxenochlorella protothecoides x Auxenochlorella symbiontica]
MQAPEHVLTPADALSPVLGSGCRLPPGACRPRLQRGMRGGTGAESEEATAGDIGEEELTPSSGDVEMEGGSGTEEEEAGASGSDEASDDDDEGEEEEEEEEGPSGSEASGSDSPPPRRPGRKPRLDMGGLTTREMPDRKTRANRYAAGEVLAEDEDGDQDFWGQEFFAEEAADEAYETESEPEDRLDQDFDEPEEEPGSGEDSDAAEAAVREPKRKALKPPGARSGALGPKRPAPASIPGAPRRRSLAPSPSPSLDPGERRGVRASTRARVEDGEAERRRANDQARVRRPARAGTGPRALTQAELLAEAARTEIENLRSLAALEAAAAEVRAAADVQRTRYVGPMLRWASRRVGDTEQTTLEVRNMALPPELERQVAPEPPPPARCAVTGALARYRDPVSGAPYADLQAFRLLRQGRA